MLSDKNMSDSVSEMETIKCEVTEMIKKIHDAKESYEQIFDELINIMQILKGAMCYKSSQQLADLYSEVHKVFKNFCSESRKFFHVERLDVKISDSGGDRITVCKFKINCNDSLAPYPNEDFKYVRQLMHTVEEGKKIAFEYFPTFHVSLLSLLFDLQIFRKSLEVKIYSEEVRLKTEKLTSNFNALKIKNYVSTLQSTLEIVSEIGTHVVFTYYPVFMLSTQKEYELKKDESVMCTICRDHFEEGAVLIKLKCGHMHCNCCMESWFRQNRSCPVCRYRPIPYKYSDS